MQTGHCNKIYSILFYLGVISIQIVGDIETGKNVTERGSVKGQSRGPWTEPWGTP